MTDSSRESERKADYDKMLEESIARPGVREVMKVMLVDQGKDSYQETPSQHQNPGGNLELAGRTPTYA